MKAIAIMILDIIWRYVLKTLSEEEIREYLEDAVEEWCKKHITKEELLAEGADAVKWLKKLKDKL